METAQPNVGEQLQPQLDLTRLPLEPALGEPRRLLGGGCEALVPVAAAAPTSHHHPLAIGQQLGLRAVEPGDDGAGRDRDQLVSATLPVHPLALAVLAPPRPEVFASPKRGQISARGIADHDDVATMAAVAPVRAAPGNVGLAPEADHAVPAATTLDVDLRLVVEHPGDVSPSPVVELLAVYDGDRPAAARRGEPDDAGTLREDRVVAPDPDSVTGTEARAALADDDLATADLLSGEDLHAEHLRVRVAPVSARADSLLLTHSWPPSSRRASWRRASSSCPRSSWFRSRTWSRWTPSCRRRLRVSAAASLFQSPRAGSARSGDPPAAGSPSSGGT